MLRSAESHMQSPSDWELSGRRGSSHRPTRLNLLSVLHWHEVNRIQNFMNWSTSNSVWWTQPWQRNTQLGYNDLFQCQRIRMHPPTLFRIEHRQMWASTKIKCKLVCSSDDHRIPRWSVLLPLEIVISTLKCVVVTSQWIAHSTSQHVYRMQENEIHVHQKSQPSWHKSPCCMVPHFFYIFPFFHISGEQIARVFETCASYFCNCYCRHSSILLQNWIPHLLLCFSRRGKVHLESKLHKLP